MSYIAKEVGDFVKKGETIGSIETDKVEIPIIVPEDGTIKEQFLKVGTTFTDRTDLYRLELGEEVKKESSEKRKSEKQAEEHIESADKPKKKENSEDKNMQPKQAETVSKKEEAKPETTANAEQSLDVHEQQLNAPTQQHSKERSESRVPMNRMRLRIAERMKEAQNVAASLTTFNEVDMSNVMKIRSTYKQQLLDKYKLKFGFMSFFVRACTVALTEFPAVNARIEGEQIVYPSFVDISVAVATPKGLVTPVLRNCHEMDLLEIEQAIHAVAEKARDGRITLDDLSGGTFTISNGGIFGSVNGTPIINTPQSAILGMHAIKNRPVVVETPGGSQIEARPMMNLALTYDHRLIDGREAVTFLVRVKEMIEEPQRMLLGI